MKTIISLDAIMILVLTLFTGLAHAGNITYYLVDYPALQQDVERMTGNTGTDYISGTITTDGTIGLLRASDILGVQFTVTSPAGSFTPSAGTKVDECTGIMASSTQLSMSASTTASLWIERCDPWSGGYAASIAYWEKSGNYNQLARVLHGMSTTLVACYEGGVLSSTSPEFVIGTVDDPITIINTHWVTDNPGFGPDTHLVVTAGGTMIFDPSVTGGYSVQSVPEPSTWAMLCATIVVLIVGYCVYTATR